MGVSHAQRTVVAAAVTNVLKVRLEDTNIILSTAKYQTAKFRSPRFRISFFVQSSPASIGTRKLLLSGVMGKVIVSV